MIEVDIQTRQAVSYLVRELPLFQQNKAIKEGLDDAALIFESLGRTNLINSGSGVRTGMTLRSLATKITVERKANGQAYSAAGFRRDTGFKAHWIDRGTRPRYTKKGEYRGFITPTFFFERAKIEGQKPAMDAIVQGIQRAVTRLNNRA